MSELLTIETEKPLARIREDLPRACANRKFGVLHVHDLKQKLREKGFDFRYETVVFDVCNPAQAKKVLDAHIEISAVLPCRIAAFETEGGKTRLATMRPSALIGLFHAPELACVAEEVEAALAAILEEAAH
jgi:uncharacterized protein (DUF302 family)